MRKSGVKILKSVVVAAAFLPFATILSCGEDSGLGASVDVNPPTIEIKYPPLAANIRDSFTLYGIWDDDKGISKIEISVIDTLTKEEVEISNNLATFNNQNNTWSIMVNAKSEDGKYELADGSYQIAATAYDGAGHATSDSRTFDIDNTPPVFVISKPGVVKSSGKSGSKYGSTFSVEGTIADDHTISEMALQVYKYNDDGSVGDLIEGDDSGEFFIEEDIATAGGSSVTYANYNNSENDPHKVRYTKLYDIEKGDEKFYCSVTVTDSTKSYTDPTESENTTSGNATSNVFLYDDVYEKYMSQKNGGLGMNANDFKNIINGSIDNAEILADLQTKQKDTASEDHSNALLFSLNPNANPTYTVNGYDVDWSKITETSDMKQASGGAQVAISIAAGLDDTGIVPYGREATDDLKALPSVKLWMKAYSSLDSIKTTATADLETLEESVKRLEADETTSFIVYGDADNATESNGWLLIYDYKQDSKNSAGSSTKSETFAATLPSGKISGGTFYLFGLTGCDMDVLYFSQATSFAFAGTENTMAATTQITYPEKNSYNKTSALTFKGYAQADGDQYVKELTAKFTCDNTTYIEKLTIAKNSDNSYTITAQDITNGEETGAVSIENGNGALTFYPKDDNNHSRGDFEFDVSKIAGYETLRSKIDSTGECYTYSLLITSSTGQDSSATQNVYVDTKAPAYDDANSSVGGVKTAEKVRNAWYSSDAVTVKGVFTEAGSGIESVKYWLDKSVDEEETGTTTATKQEDGTYKFSATIGGLTETAVDSNGDVNAHTLRIIGYDKAENEAVVREYSLKIDMTYPDFSAKYYKMGAIEDAINGSILTNKQTDIELYGLVSDAASGVASVTIPNATVTYTTQATVDENEISLVDTTENIKTWIESATFSDYNSKNATAITGWKAVISKDKITSGEVKATVTDVASTSTSPRLFEFNVDTTPPEVKVTELTTADSSLTGTQPYINGKVQFGGTANDNNQLQEISGFQYKIGTGEWTTLYAANVSSSAYSWKTAEIDTSATPFAASKNADLKVSFRAIALDKAGNKSAGSGTTDGSDEGYSFTINQNTDRPVIIVQELENDSDIIISKTTIMGTISDDDGIQKLEYKDTNTKNNVDASTSWQELTVSSGTWKIEGLAAGSHGITFRVTDKAGSTFETGKSNGGTFATNAEPYLAYGEGEKADNGTALAFKVDVKAPEIKSIKVAATSNTTAPSSTAYAETKSYGSSAKYMWITATAAEDVAVNAAAEADVSLKVGSETVSVTSSNVTRTGEVSALSYKIGPIDTADLSGEGTLTVSLVLKDKSGRSSDAATCNVYFDKAAPVVSVTAPNVTGDGIATVGVSADAIVGTTTLRGQISDASKLAKFYYIIPDATQKAAIDATSYTFNATGWTEMSDVVNADGEKLNTGYKSKTSMIWQIPIVSSKFTMESGEGLSLVYYATATTGTQTKTLTYAEKIDGSTNVYVPLYFYAEDETGKGQIYKNKILVDPIGGIPVVEIITPEQDALTKTGGNLNFQGTASDDAGDLEKVVMTKLEFSTDEVTESTDLSTVAWYTVKSDILNEDGVVTKGIVGEDGTITASGKASWKVSIVTSKISKASDGNLATLVGTKTEDNKTVAKDITIARATFVAYDKNGTASTFQVATANDVTTLNDDDKNALVSKIFVDKNAPQLTNVQLVQFADSDGNDKTPTDTSVTPTISRSYSAGMFISGNTGTKKWYLKGTVTDDASVEGITITSDTDKYRALEGSVSKADPSSNANIIVNSTGDDALGEKTCTFLIPIDTETRTNTKTQFYATIELDDGQHTDVTQNLSFFVDNTAPALYTTADTKTTELAHAATLRLKDNSGLVVGTENVVENSDGSYTFGDTIEESGSGLAYVAVYFTKESDSKYYSTISNSTATSGVTIGSGKTLTFNSEKLPVLSATVTRGSGTTLTYAEAASNANITVGTLVKIGGSYHLITEKTNAGVITLADDVDTSFTTAEFVYAHVVNHQVAEGFNSDWSISNDDDDGLVEMVKQTGANYKWTSSIRSDNIPDGPAQIHVVAFDEAGNVNSGYVATSIQNNRPRISKVFLGTDLNGNGKFDYYSETSTGAVAANNELYPAYTSNGTEFGELSFYSALTSDGKIQGSVTLKSNAFVAKDKLLVLPEIIGGNTTETNDLKYLYKVVDSASEATVTKTTDTSSTSVITTLVSLSSDASSLSLADKTGTQQTVEELLAENHKADKWNYYDTTTSDYEEGTAHGGVVTGKYKGFVLDNDTLENYESWTSGQAVGEVKYFAFTIWDATSGTTQGKDSLYSLLKIPMIVNVDDDISPKAEIHPFYWNSKSDGSFYYDDEGNAEGHIDILPSSKEDDTSEKPGVSGKVWVKVTVTDETRLSSAIFTDPAGNNHTVAKYEGGEWVAQTLSSPLSEIEFIDTPEPNQAGHTMTYRVAIDMTSYGLAEGKTVDASARDKKSNSSVSSSTQTIKKALTSHYIMDFVPYIKSIYPATESSAARSRLGRFPVQAGKDMVIEGMNFAAGATYKVTFYKTKANATEGDVQGTADSTTLSGTVKTDGQITVKAPEYSRYVEVSITQDRVTLSTKNNTNENLGCNIEEGYVEKDSDLGLSSANKAGTNFWTDDRYIAVWNVDNDFVGSTTPQSGLVKKISKLNSGTGATTDTVGGGVLYKQPDSNTQVDTVTGQNDHYYAALSSYDLKVYGYRSTKSYTSHGDNVIYNSSEAAFMAPADELDYTIVNGLPYYVMQDNALCGDSANRWGSGLFLSREGYWYDRAYSSAYTSDLQENQEYYIIERLGASGSTAASRNSSGGYDAVLHQFKNPRIAGWHKAANEVYRYDSELANGGTDYIYISYYDSYAKCLKYAAYKVGREFDPNNHIRGIAGQHWGSHNQNSAVVPLMHGAPNKAYAQNSVSESNNMTTGNHVVAGYDTTTTNPTSFVEKAGEWSDMMIDVSSGTPIPVIIYYNETNKCLEIARGKQSVPVTGCINGSGSATNSTGWTKTTGITPSRKIDFGRYVSAVMDKNWNIHAAAQDVDNGKLYYLYLTKNGDAYDTQVCVPVDSSGTSGMWTDIELTSDASSNIEWYEFKPVISHLDKGKLNTTKAAKVAYVVTETKDGATSAYWESMTDPSRYSANDQRTSVMADVYEQGSTTYKAPVAVGFNSDMLALDFLRAEE